MFQLSGSAGEHGGYDDEGGRARRYVSDIVQKRRPREGVTVDNDDFGGGGINGGGEDCNL